MTSWQALSDEAARWRDAGRTADLWWRDDDAARRSCFPSALSFGASELTNWLIQAGSTGKKPPCHGRVSYTGRPSV